MVKPSSVEVGPPAPSGETRPRRYFATQAELSKSPEPSVLVIPDLLAKSVSIRPDQPAVGWRDVLRTHTEEKEITKTVGGKKVTEKKNWNYFELSDYKYLTYRELEEKVRFAGSALRQVGVEKGKMFNIFASTSKEWQIMANACASQSITFATAYDSLGEEGLQHSITEPEVYGLFTNASLLSTVAAIVSSTPSLKVLIYDGDEKDIKKGSLEKIREAGVDVHRFEEFLELGKKNPREMVKPSPQDVATIMYTSGSSGAPKGCVITHENVVSCVAGVMTVLGDLITPDARFIAYLPLAHIFEMTVEFTLLYVGIPMGFANVKTLTDNSVRNCMGDIRAFKPTIMTGVPAVWELIRKGILSKVTSGGSLKSGIFHGALAAKNWTKKIPLVGSVVDVVTDKVVFSQVKAATGGNLKYAVNGGAPISESTQQFLSSVLTPNFIQGYGCTESVALSAILPPSMAAPGKAGLPVPSCQIKLRDFEEAGYFAQGTPQQGEICIGGPAICKGYYKRPDLTKEAFVDGWFLTGDIGRWNSDGTLSIIDRKKNLIKLSGGEYIGIEKLESVYKSSNLVGNLMVHATSDANRPMAVVFPHENNLKPKASELGASSTDLSSLCQSAQVRDAILKDLNQAGKAAGFAPLEMLQTVVLCDEEWTPQNGLLTAAQKLNRKEITKKYKSEIDAVYP